MPHATRLGSSPQSRSSIVSAIGVAVQIMLSVVLAAVSAVPGLAQDAANAYRVRVVDSHDQTPIAGANVSVRGTTIGRATGVDGVAVVTGIPSGTQTIVISFVGYEVVERSHVFPLADPGFTHLVALEEAHEDLEVVSVTATRTSRTIADQAVRVETIAGEEIDEKISMEPASITMLLNESPGITVQQTSAVSGGASIRIQGLDGRYTQLLKDGFPLFGGFSGGLSLLQVPPLDLQQVEVIKGPASTLYGGDAIAGLVNLVSKSPTESPQLSLLANATTAGGFDLGGFYSSRGKRFGTTVLITGNAQQAYDPDDDAFSNIPKTRRITVSPKLYVYPSSSTTLSVHLTGTVENREGGDLDVIANGVSEQRAFFETNKSTRTGVQGRVDHVFGSDRASSVRTILTVKHSTSVFDRSIEVPDYRFQGLQVATYTEASVLMDRSTHDVVVGVDVRSDAFEENEDVSAVVRDYTYVSAGLFIQDTWDVADRTLAEAGIRIDRHNVFGMFVLPKVSIAYRMTDQLTWRVGGGLGYKAPTVFLEPSEERAFRDVLPLDGDVSAERSVGGSVDVNYRTLLFERVALSVNQAVYFTNLDDPIVPTFPDGPGAGRLRYATAGGAIKSAAAESNVKVSLDDLKLFLGYVYLRVRASYLGSDGDLPLTPKHKTYTVLVYEKHGQGRIGLEAYYTGPQSLAQGQTTSGFWIMGIMAERRFGRARVFVNFENILDTKQSNYAPVVLGNRVAPEFPEVWAPMDGFVVNGGLKFNL